MLRSVERATRETVSPLERLEYTLHPSSFILGSVSSLCRSSPLQTLVYRSKSVAFTESIAIAVIVGLCVGKPLGIVLFSFIAVRAGLAKLPKVREANDDVRLVICRINDLTRYSQVVAPVTSDPPGS